MASTGSREGEAEEDSSSPPPQHDDSAPGGSQGLRPPPPPNLPHSTGAQGAYSLPLLFPGKCTGAPGAPAALGARRRQSGSGKGAGLKPPLWVPTVTPARPHHPCEPPSSSHFYQIEEEFIGQRNHLSFCSHEKAHFQTLSDMSVAEAER